MTILWIAGSVLGSFLLLFARSLGRHAWGAYGEPYGFGSPRGFQFAQAAVGAAVLVCSCVALLLPSRLDPTGIAVLIFGAQMCVRSRALGVQAALAAHRDDDVPKFQQGVMAAGVGLLLFAPIVLFRL